MGTCRIGTKSPYGVDDGRQAVPAIQRHEHRSGGGGQGRETCAGHGPMNRRTLWNHIEARLDSQLPDWRKRTDELRQLDAVEKRVAGRTWSDDEVFEAVLLAVLSSNTDWSKIERVRTELSDLFARFSLESYASLAHAEIGDRFVPWFKARKAASTTLGQNLVNLIDAARILLKYSRTHGAADGYFTSLVQRCGEDPKLAALRLGCPGAFKLPSLGVPLAAEALKNLGFDVAKPDRHLMRAIGSFGLVHFGRWTDSGEWKRGTATPVPTPRRQLLAITAAQEIAQAVDERVVLVDNAIWLLCARSELHLTNLQLAEMARTHELPKDHDGDHGGHVRSPLALYRTPPRLGETERMDEPPQDKAESLGGLLQSWMNDESEEEQRETIEFLLRALDEDRLSDRKLFPEELKGKT